MSEQKPLAERTYKVVAGDTGAEIAKKFGVSISALESANPGVNWNDLQVGHTIHIPGHANGPSNPSIGHGPLSDEGSNGDPTIRHYSGPASSFPNPEHWQKFSLMWARDAKVLAINDSAAQIEDIREAIQTVAAQSGIDRRVILSTIMQESQGNVHVRTTVSPDGRVRNPGLMQTHNGVAFNPHDEKGSILQMVRDGVLGTQSGDGLVQLLKRYGNIYSALRGYNSGSVDEHNLSNGLGATANYVSDIANRLMGAPPN
jgi:LysM repeat protein